MNRMRTLLVIGVFMLSLAVLAALEWRVQEPVASEGQMVTGSLSKEVPSLPQLPDLSTVENGKGVLVPLDNGTLRGSTGSALDMVAKAPTETSSPTAPETAAPSAPSVSTPSGPETVPSNPATETHANVYVTKTGKRYHYDSHCNGGTYYPSTLADALARGLTPCNKCVK